MQGGTVRGLLEMARPTNAIAAGILTFIGAYVAGGIPDAALAASLAVSATILATAAGNGINDYFDRDIDRINQPNRPIPRGAVAPRTALFASSGAFVAAIGLVLLLPWMAIAIALINLILLVSYTSVFKGTPGAGNVVVSFLVGSTFLFGAAAVGDIGPTTILFLLAAVSTFAREVIKDVEDVPGDRNHGLRTLPVTIGIRRSLWVAAVAMALAILASPVPFIIGDFGAAYLIVVFPAVAVMALGSATAFRNPTRGQQLIKAGMFLAAIAFIVGRAAL